MYLIRFGEIGIKSPPVRKRALQQLVQNIKHVLDAHGKQARVWHTRNRVYVDGTEQNLDQELKHIFGIVSFSKVTKIPFTTLQELVTKITPYYTNQVKGKTYGVRVKRTGKHDFTSKEAEKAIATPLYSIAKGVDLTNPDTWVKLEIRDQTAYLIHNTQKGPGGLPTGFEGKALALYSGGIDSPVASWLMLKRGVKLDFIYFDLGDPALIYTSFKKFAQQWCQYQPKFYVVKLKNTLVKLYQIESKYRQILLKTIMYKIASTLNYPALITGESLAQASTQTLTNLAVITTYTDKLVLRPLIGYDKEDTINLAKTIGTYEESIKIPEFCNLATGKVITHAKPHIIKKLMEQFGKLNYSIEKYDLNTPVPQATSSTLAKNQVHIDLDEQGIEDILENIEAFDKHKAYLITCKTGLKAKILAELLKEQGIQATSRAKKDELGEL